MGVPVRVRRYADDAAERFDATTAQILGASQQRGACLARAEVMRRLRGDGFNTVQIGRWLGRNHATVIYWTDPGYRRRHVARRNAR